MGAAEPRHGQRAASSSEPSASGPQRRAAPALPPPLPPWASPSPRSSRASSARSRCASSWVRAERPGLPLPGPALPCRPAVLRCGRARRGAGSGAGGAPLPFLRGPRGAREEGKVGTGREAAALSSAPRYRRGPGAESRAEAGGPRRARFGPSLRRIRAGGRDGRAATALGNCGVCAAGFRRAFCPPALCLVRQAGGARRFSRSSARLGSAGCPRPDGSAAWRLFPSAAQQIKRWQPKIPTGRSRFKRSRAAPPRSALPPPLLFSFSALPACVCPQLRGPAPRRVPRPLCWAGAAPRAGSWLNLLGSGQPCASARSPALLMTLNGARSAGEPGCSGRWCLRTALRARNARHSKTACKGFGFLTGT